MIVAGFGFRDAATVASLQDALRFAQGTFTVDAIATEASKAQAKVFQDFAACQTLPLYAVVKTDLTAQTTDTQSTQSQIAYGTGSVAEAAALAAAGPGARLIAPRYISTDRMATCALAKGEPS